MIVIDEKSLDPIIANIKRLPVHGDFKAADAWVGIVLELERLKLTSIRYNGEEGKNNG